MTYKKELAIVFGSTGNMVFALGNMLIGLKKHNSELKADFIVYEQNISENDKNLLKFIISCDFKKYQFPKKDILTEDTLKKFSELSFSRFECFNLLKEYKNVLWLYYTFLFNQLLIDFINKI